jgi:hypothetical protein
MFARIRRTFRQRSYSDRKMTKQRQQTHDKKSQIRRDKNNGDDVPTKSRKAARRAAPTNGSPSASSATYAARTSAIINLPPS